jgi:hypothetical protein
MNRILPTIALVLAASAPAIAAPAQAPVTGQVMTNDGHPLADVFVQQTGTIASTVSDEQGRFTLRLDPKGKQSLTFSTVGYTTREVALPVGGPVKLDPVPTYRPSFVPAPPESVTAGNHRFDTQIGLNYRLRNETYSYNGRNVTGWANNEIYGDARYRYRDVVLGLNGYRNKVPLTIGNVANQPSTAPSLENSQWNLSLGYAFGFDQVEILPSLVYSSYYYVPSSAGIPWTGSPLDYTQTKQNLGARIEAGTRMGNWELLGSYQWIPYATAITGAPSSITQADTAWGDLGATLGYNLLPGLRLNLTYDWQSNYGQDTAHVFGIGMSYHPERVTP